MPRLHRLMVACLLLSAALVGIHPAQGAALGSVRGAISAPGADALRAQVRLFSADWKYLGVRHVRGGLYSLRLAPGTYWLQFVDLRPAYDVRKLAPADVRVTVRAGRTTLRHVRMKRGAALVGSARTPKGRAAGARILAVNTVGQSYQTTANRRGEYAIGGLPAGNYSVFLYVRDKQWTARSTWLPGVRQGRMYQRTLHAKVQAGRLLIDLYGGNAPVAGRAAVTVVSLSTGQFWTALSSRGTVVFAGLHPGRYRIEAGGVGDFLPARGVLRAVVRKRGASFADFHYPVTGAKITGTAVDAVDPAKGLAKALVILYDRHGAERARNRADALGRFTLGGQLTTGPDYTVVVHPDPDSGGWHQTSSYCPFASARRTGIALVTGENTEVGQVALARRIADDTPTQCLPPEPDPAPAGETTPAGLVDAR